MLKNQHGFTLIEMLVVVAIISILFVAVSPQLNSIANKSNVDVVETDFRSMQTGIQQHYIDNRHGDFTEVEVKEYLDFSFVQYSDPADPFLQFRTAHKNDPWENPYRLYINNEGLRYVMLHSYGPNGEEDLAGNEIGDDILFVFYPNE